MIRPPMASSKRTHRYEKLARLYDREILPIWAERFGRMLLRGLTPPTQGQILDVACGTGYPSVEIVRRMGESCRLIMIDASSTMLEVARKKIAAKGHKGVFIRTESASPKLSFADDVYDLVVCNLGLAEMLEPASALADFARVTRPGGEIRVTLPLAGTFAEFYDIYNEVLVKHDKHETLERLGEHLHAYPSPEQCEAWLASAGLVDTRVEVEKFSLLFRSSREFFFAPVIEYGPLSAWKRIAGTGQELQDVFWYIKEAIDAYFGGRAFEVSIVAGCLRGRKPTEAELDEPTAEVAPIGFATAAVGDDEPVTEEVEIDAALPRAMLEAETAAEADYDDVELDAFAEGAERPEHLDET
jgi:ubiquinone/menaquinone biosynthesis C-methylase UbiE